MSTRRFSYSREGFELLYQKSQRKVSPHEHILICLMVLTAATSIFWSVSIHLISSDFDSEIIGAKVYFRPRDFEQMSERAREIFYEDLGRLINETYSDFALKTTSKAIGNELITAEKHVMTREKEYVGSVKAENENSGKTTKAPKPRKIPHLFQFGSKSIIPDNKNEGDIDYDTEENETTIVPKSPIDVERDRKFLASMTVDMHRTLWRQSTSRDFIYSFPFLSEIIAIVWTAMCLVFQSNVKKHWGLPKPWRIVLPSIVVFCLMTLGSLIYAIMAYMQVKYLCRDLRENLSDPNIISCGQAMSVLRPVVRHHEFSHAVYLNLFHISYFLALILWLLALIVMTLRYILAVDFQLIDMAPEPEYKVTDELAAHKGKESEFTEVLLNTPESLQKTRLHVKQERPRSEDDFQSAKSHLSEVSTPLL